MVIASGAFGAVRDTLLELVVNKISIIVFAMNKDWITSNIWFVVVGTLPLFQCRVLPGLEITRRGCLFAIVKLSVIVPSAARNSSSVKRWRSFSISGWWSMVYPLPHPWSKKENIGTRVFHALITQTGWFAGWLNGITTIFWSLFC